MLLFAGRVISTPGRQGPGRQIPNLLVFMDDLMAKDLPLKDAVLCYLLSKKPKMLLRYFLPIACDDYCMSKMVPHHLKLIRVPKSHLRMPC